ncbi:MAG: hypothetical protein B6U89_02935 [Desulfurococcales archaeon ex4484_58]|nr:MAG: hypothetical protein B6U89_02935 [Desulfurococcales archaeon ex4484_58]
MKSQSKTTHVKIILILTFLLTLLYTPTIYSNTNISIVKKQEYKTYPNNAVFEHNNTYTIGDYDKDNRLEAIITLTKDRETGLLFIVEDTKIEGKIIFKNFKPYRTFILNDQIYVIGYFTKNKTFGIITLDKNLNIIDKVLFNKKYPESLSIKVVSETSIYGDEVLFTINIASSNIFKPVYSDLIMYNVSNRSFKILYIIDYLENDVKPVRIGDKIICGSVIIETRTGKIYEIIRGIRELPHRVHDQLLFDDKIYTLVSTPYATYFTVYDLLGERLDKMKILSYDEVVKTSLIELNNNYYIYLQKYVSKKEQHVFIEYYKTIICDQNYTEKLAFSTSKKSGLGIGSKYAYILHDNELYVFNGTYAEKLYINLTNTENLDVKDIIVLKNNIGEETLIVLYHSGYTLLKLSYGFQLLSDTIWILIGVSIIIPSILYLIYKLLKRRSRHS